MKERFIDRTRIKVISILALFNFLFLGIEYLFDNMMAYVTDSEHVVLAQSYILGASVIGFLMFPVLKRLMKVRLNFALMFSASMISVICLFMILQHMSYGMILIFGCIVFVILGIFGSGIHYLAACVLGKSPYLARTVGVAYAIGLLMQFLNHHLVNNDAMESVVLSVFLMIWVILIEKLMLEGKGKQVDWDELREKRNMQVLRTPLLAGGVLLTVVWLMTCIFATLDNVVTLFHAQGSADIGQWPRLLLAVSGLLAGVLFDIREHRYMQIIMYCITLLSVICVLIIETGGPFLIGLSVFYLSAGFFVVYFTTGFMDLSDWMKVPELWAGIGRAANNLCAVLIGPASLAVVKTKNSIVISIITLIIFALISIAMFIYSTLCKEEAVTDEPKLQSDTEDENLRFERFAQFFALTPRERDVLKILLVSDDNVQDIAEQLFISRAALYRHISSLNEKTKTKSRIGLLQLYFGWKEM